MKIRVLAVVIACVVSIHAQPAAAGKGANNKATDKDIDPLALQVLKAATDPIKQSQSFSFRVLVSREHLGTNGQIITLFHTAEVTVQRPDKLHINFRGRGKDVKLFYNAGQAVLFSPDENFYSTIPSPATIDQTLDALEKKGVFLSASNFLESDPYQSLTDDLVTGYVIGKVAMFGETVHHLAFTEPDAEWQLWVTGGDHPQVRRLEVINKSLPERPRITVDFLDWNLNASPNSNLFTFEKPADAKQIEMLNMEARK